MKDKNTKNNIVCQAVQLFQEKGYDSVTIVDICRKSEVSKHTFYYYFSSKEEIISAIHTIPDEFRSQLLAQIVEAPNYVEKLWSFYQYKLCFYNHLGLEIVKRLLMMYVNGRTDIFHDDSYKEIEVMQITSIENAKAAGEINNTAPGDELLIMLNTQMVGLLSTWCAGNGTFDLVEEGKKTMAYVIGRKEGI